MRRKRGALRAPKDQEKPLRGGVPPPPAVKSNKTAKLLYQSDTSEQVENTKVNADILLRNSAK